MKFYLLIYILRITHVIKSYFVFFQVSLGGGIGECSSSTLDIPDFDLNVWWELDENLLKFISIVPVGNSSLYKLQVQEPNCNNRQFLDTLGKFVFDIQTHGNPSVHGARHDFSNIFVKSDTNNGYYINANIMRNQMDGIIHHLNALGYSPTDFSDTGAARTVILKLSMFCSENLLLNQFISLFPNIEVDYVPQFKVPYKFLPESLKRWEKRQSTFLTAETKEKIKCRGGILVAKTSKKEEETSCVTWRLSISPMDIFNKDVYPGCDVTRVLTILKDLRKIGLSSGRKKFVRSYCMKNVILWCINEDQQHGMDEYKLIKLVLQKLTVYYRQNFMPDFFDDACNLIEDIPEQEFETIANIIDNIGSNINEMITRCLAEQNIQREAYKATIEKSGVLPLLKSAVVNPDISSNLIFQALSCYMNKLGYPKEAINIFQMDNNTPFRELFKGFISSVAESTSKLCPMSTSLGQIKKFSDMDLD